MKKICFAVLVHEKKEIVEDMLKNIRYFCPNSSIVLYNGGSNKGLCDGLGYPVCPTSKRLYYMKTAPYLLEVMKWLQQMGWEYDYLINLDSDALFARKGFEKFICETMSQADFMGPRVRSPERGWMPGVTIKREWPLWQDIFQMNSEECLGCFNVGQTFSKRLVAQILSFDKIKQIEKNFYKSQARTLIETVYVTLAKSLGFSPHSYPPDTGRCIRFRPYYSQQQVKEYLQNNPNSFLFHPIQRNFDDEARSYIRGLIH